jgi:hypothetical protein
VASERHRRSPVDAELDLGGDRIIVQRTPFRGSRTAEQGEAAPLQRLGVYRNRHGQHTEECHDAH